LNYVSGRPGNEIFLTFRNVGGSGLFFTRTGFICNSAKADWPLEGRLGHNWMWPVAAIGGMRLLTNSSQGCKRRHSGRALARTRNLEIPGSSLRNVRPVAIRH